MALGVGLVGCGTIARSVHLDILRSAPGARLVAVAEIDDERRTAVERRVGTAVAYRDFEELIADSRVDAVVICLPPRQHAPASIAAHRAGKHVYLEKPLAVDLGAAAAAIDAWRVSGRVGMIGFNYRFNALYRRARELIRSERLGRVVAIQSVFCSVRRQLPEWKQTVEEGGGVLLDLASHHIDLVRFLLEDEIREVQASVRSVHTQADTAMLQMHLDGGVSVQSLFSLAAVDEDRFEVYFARGKLSIDRYLALSLETAAGEAAWGRLKPLGRVLGALSRTPYRLSKLRRPEREPSYQAALSHFISCATAGVPASPDFADGYRSLVVVDAAARSARRGVPEPIAGGIPTETA